MHPPTISPNARPSSARAVYKRLVATAQGIETIEVAVRCPRCQVMTFVEDDEPAEWRPRTPPPETFGSLQPALTTVGAAMTRDVVCVRRDVSTRALRQIFVEKAIGCAPVVDEYDRLIGVVSKTDLVREPIDEPSDDTRPLAVRTRAGWTYVLGGGFHLEPDGSTVVAEVMTPTTIRIGETETLDKATALMARHGVHRLVVHDDEGQIVGILSATDVVAWVARASAEAGS